MSKIKKEIVHIENTNKIYEDAIKLGAKMSGMARTLLLPKDLDTNEIIIIDPKSELNKEER